VIFCEEKRKKKKKKMVTTRAQKKESSAVPWHRHPIDLTIVFFFCIFTWSSLVMEMYIAFAADLRGATDLHGRLWRWYAQFDPIFFDTPLYLRIMCTIDGFVFGAFYPFAIYGIIRRAPWLRLWGVAYAAAIVYSTVVYFGVELIGACGRLVVKRGGRGGCWFSVCGYFLLFCSCL
jgi:hypothetical protein